MKRPKPERVLLTGPETEIIRPLLDAHDFHLVDSDPDLVICHGGDGTLIGAERQWPGVPKLAIRRSRHCKKCPDHADEIVVASLAEGNYSRLEFLKVQAETKGKIQVGLNEVLIHNVNSTTAVRYIVNIEGTPLTHEIVGDGLVVATPFGSSGYFRSITNSTFQIGLGLAFNNCTESIDHIVLRPEALVRVKITRGPAHLASDNNPEVVPLDRGDEILIKRHTHPAIICMVDTLFCPKCKRVRETDSIPDHIDMRPDFRGRLTADRPSSD